MGNKVWEQLKKMRKPRGWVLEERDPVVGQVRAYMHDLTETMHSEAVSPWVTLFGPKSLEECQRERDKYIDKSRLRIRNVETDEHWP